ncbi:hypothetical protein ACIBHY_02860 [Nonomuraea sp. NPDC050547]
MLRLLARAVVLWTANVSERASGRLRSVGDGGCVALGRVAMMRGSRLRRA